MMVPNVKVIVLYRFESKIISINNLIACGKLSIKSDYETPLFFAEITQTMPDISFRYCIGTPVNRETILVAKHCIATDGTNMTIRLGLIDFYQNKIISDVNIFREKNIIKVRYTIFL